MATIHPPAYLLAGKVAIITGAAMGLGKGMARVFVREGARVLAADRDPAVMQVAAELGPDCIPFIADVSREDDVAAMFEQAVASFGRLDILVNNAAVIVSHEPELSTASHEAFNQTNILGVMQCCRHAIEIMTACDGGAIVNVSSVGSLNAEDRASMAYSAGKAAVNSLTRSIAVKYGAQGIRANGLAPGFTHIEKTMRAPQETIAPMEEKSAMKRTGHVEEQAQVAAFLASDRASYVNGVILPVDGGWSARLA